MDLDKIIAEANLAIIATEKLGERIEEDPHFPKICFIYYYFFFNK